MDPFNIAQKHRKTFKKNTQNLQERDEITSGSNNSTRNSEEFQHVFHVHPIPNGPLEPLFFGSKEPLSQGPGLLQGLPNLRYNRGAAEAGT